MHTYTHMYMHNGQRDLTDCVNERDWVSRDTERGTVDSIVSEPE